MGLFKDLFGFVYCLQLRFCSGAEHPAVQPPTHGLPHALRPDGAVCAQVPGLFHPLELCRRLQDEGPPRHERLYPLRHHHPSPTTDHHAHPRLRGKPKNN